MDISIELKRISN